MALLKAAWHVRHRIHAEHTQGPNQDREPGQTVRIEVTEHHDPLAGRARRIESLHEDSSVRQERGIEQSSLRRGEERRELCSPHAPAREQIEEAIVQPTFTSCRGECRIELQWNRKGPAEPGLDHGAQNARSAFTPTLPQLIYPPDVPPDVANLPGTPEVAISRRLPGGPGAFPAISPFGGPPIPATRQGAGLR